MTTAHTTTNPEDDRQHIIVGLDLGEFKRIVVVGARRAALFMGLGLNAMSQDDMINCHLHRIEFGGNP